MHTGWAVAVEALTLVPIALLVIGAWRDLATRTIPNWVCLAAGCIGLLLRGLQGFSALAWSAAAGTLLFLALVALHARGMLGGGDVKLATATALGLPALSVANFIFATTMAGGILAALHLALRWLPDPLPCPSGATALRRVIAIERWRIRRKGPLPYGVAIACGGAWIVISPLLA